jgi:hypothetical protein
MRQFKKHFSALTEAFDKPYRFEGGEAMRGLWAYEFRTDDRSYIMVKFEENEISDSESSWNVNFEREGKMDITGEGDAMRIFATVIEIIKVFTKKKKPHILRFTAAKPLGKASKELSSRESLYKKLVQRYAPRMGYKYDAKSSDRETDFYLTRK